MDKKIFETHLLSERNQPFIFHLDVQKNNATNKLSMNWHSSIELLYFTQGEGTVICGAQNYTVSAGDLFIVNANMPHAICSENIVYYYCLIIDDKFCDANDIQTGALIYKTPVRDQKASGMFEGIITEFHQNLFCKSAGIKVAILNLMLYLTRNYVETISTPNHPVATKDENIKLAIGYMKSHIAQKMTLDEIANEAGLSKFYFLREFKKMTGETPISFINKTRCETAKKMLLTGQYSIKEISEKIGFDDVSYFSKNFKKYTEFTPSEYVNKYSRQ